MKRVLVIQLCRLGDILQTTPMLRGLRRHHPGAHVTLVLHDAFGDAPIPTALYDRLVPWPVAEMSADLGREPASWRRQVDRLRALVADIAREPFDVTLNLTHSDLSGLLAAAIPTREVRGGLVAPDRTRIVCGPVMTYFWASQTARAQGCFNLVDLHNWMAGVPSEGSGLEIAISDQARERVARWLAARNLAAAPLIAVQLGASDERKRWPAERFAEVLERLPPALGEPVLVGAATERPLADRAVRSATRPVHDAIGETSVPELAALLERSRLLLTNDTGTMHVAAAVGTRVIDVSTGPVFAHETGPYGAGHLVIEPVIECFPCAAGSTCHHLDCRERIRSEDVAALARYALGCGPLPRPRTARVLEATFAPSGRITYGPVWSPNAEWREVARQAAADVWEATLPVPTAAGFVHPTGRVGPASGPSARAIAPVPLEPPGSAGDRLIELARQADALAELARGIPAAYGAQQTLLVARLQQGLERLRLAGEIEVACQPLVAYLRVRLDSAAVSDLSVVAALHADELTATADRARRLARGLASRHDGEGSPSASPSKAAS